MRTTGVIFRRELASYFATPVAVIFIVIFVMLTGIFTFYPGSYFDRGQADLQPFFFWHPILYLLLIPAVAMRLWAEERKSGTVELLMTLPVTMAQAVCGKFLAAWAFTGIALLLTTPMWLTVAYLGEPDHGVILASYLGSFLMAGAYLAVGAFVSAFTKNQVVAFVIAVVILLLFVMAGFPMVVGWLSGWAPEDVVEAVEQFSFWTHFESIQRGVLDARDLVFFVSVMALFLFLNALTIDLKKAD